MTEGYDGDLDTDLNDSVFGDPLGSGGGGDDVQSFNTPDYPTDGAIDPGDQTGVGLEPGSHINMSGGQVDYDAGEATLDTDGDGRPDTAVRENEYQIEYYTDTDGDGDADELTITTADDQVVSHVEYDAESGEFTAAEFDGSIGLGPAGSGSTEDSAADGTPASVDTPLGDNWLANNPAAPELSRAQESDIATELMEMDKNIEIPADLSAANAYDLDQDGVVDAVYISDDDSLVGYLAIDNDHDGVADQIVATNLMEEQSYGSVVLNPQTGEWSPGPLQP